MFGPHFVQPEKHEGRSAEGGNAFGLLMQCLTEGQQAGVFRPGDALSLALGAWSLVHGLASLMVDGGLERTGKRAVDAEALAVAQTRMLLEGRLRGPQNG